MQKILPAQFLRRGAHPLRLQGLVPRIRPPVAARFHARPRVGIYDNPAIPALSVIWRVA